MLGYFTKIIPLYEIGLYYMRVQGISIETLYICFPTKQPWLVQISHIYPSIAVDCGPLTEPANGGISLPFTTRGAEAVYSCNVNYTLVGVAVSVCMDDGTWSESSDPVCEGELKK